MSSLCGSLTLWCSFVVAQTAKQCEAEGATVVETHATDLTSTESREKLISGLLAKHGTIDILVNNAGIGVKGTPLEGGCDKESTTAVLYCSKIQESTVLQDSEGDSDEDQEQRTRRLISALVYPKVMRRSGRRC